MTTASEIINDALIDINALAPGQPTPSNNSASALRRLNDLLDSLSTDQDFIYTTVENILQWVPNQYKYTIGNPVGGQFSGTLIASNPTISGVTVPTALIVGGTITDSNGAIPANTVVIAIGTNTVTLSQNALFNVPAPELFTFTVPGDFPIQRPLRINNGYTRLLGDTNNGLDYWFDSLSMERYNELGYKGQPGPWPIALAYQPTFPLGTIWVYPCPGQSCELHLFTDLILSEFSDINQDIALPQGYNRALKKLLAIELCPSWGKTPSPMLLKAASEARSFIKSLNASPVVTLRYDTEILHGNRSDASWIVHGGFV